MGNNNIVTWIVVIIIAILGVWLWQSGTDSSPSVPLDTEAIMYGNGQFFLNDFSENELITSPLSLSGEAVGPWYFEASFPIELKDGNGVVIADTIGETQSDWMVNTFVPFTATLTFATPATPSGTLILHKENPSGEPAYDDELIIPITF